MTIFLKFYYHDILSFDSFLVLVPTENHKNEKKTKSVKKTKIEIEQDIIHLIHNNDDLLLQISTFQTIKFEQMEQFSKNHNIKISKGHLQKFLDEQGICFALPDDQNAVKGPRRIRKKRKR